MLDIKFIRENPDLLDKVQSNAGRPPVASAILIEDEKLSAVQSQLQAIYTRRNELARSIGRAKQEGVESGHLDEANAIKVSISDLERKEVSVSIDLQRLMDNVPNLPLPEVPVAPNESGNELVRHWGTPPVFDFTPLDHVDLGERLGMMDFAAAASMSGARFTMLKRDLAKLERALASFMLDLHTNNFGYIEIMPPSLVLDRAMYNVGQLPKFEEESFAVNQKYRLIPTAEVPLTNMVADKILAEEELPVRYVAYTNCFRAEAGSAGRDTRGMVRNHQFSKVELVSIVRPQDSAIEHERMLSAAEEVLRQLELPYRVMLLCTGDLGFSSAKTYDLEVWLPSQNCYREISSCSNCTDFQARRMKARYKERHTGRNMLLHTLNGSGLAIGRTIVAILECYQNVDGSIAIPKKLQPYMGGISKIGG